MAVRILVNDDEPAIVQALKTLLTREGYEVATTRTCERALELLQEESFSLLITDIVMRPMNGIELLRRARDLHPHMAVIVITGFGSVETAVDAMKYGAFDYITKPFRIADLVLTVQRAIAYEAALAENASLREALRVRYRFDCLVGHSTAMRQVFSLIEHIANSTDTVLIVGEEGTEKDEVARVLHDQSDRAGGPFVTVGCNELEEEDLIQQLFGAHGFASRAEGGTAYLRDLEGLPPALQYKLPDVLRRCHEEAENTVKSTRGVRLVVSMAEPPSHLVDRGDLAGELVRELHASTLHLPPLRERIEDLPSLTRHYLNAHEEKEGTYLAITPQAMRAMELYNWPGNLQELENVLKRAASRAQGNSIDLEHLDEALRKVGKESRADEVIPAANGLRWRSLHSFLQDKENEYISQILRVTDHDHEEAARILGIDVEEFEQKLAKVGL